MQILDRYTGCLVNESDLPKHIDLGRYALISDSVCRELTSKNFEIHDGQYLCQELLKDANKDVLMVFKRISDYVEIGDFSSVPLLFFDSTDLVIGDFADKLKENFKHIEAIFQNPYTKLNRSIEKVAVSKAKRISNRSNQYLAAHTEDWLHKGLVRFQPSRILTEEYYSDENIYENQLLIAFVSRAIKYLERKIKYTELIQQFSEDYSVLINKFNNSIGWYKKIRRELKLAGDVYYEDSGNYSSVRRDSQKASSTMIFIDNLKNSLLRLNQYDLFHNVDQRLVRSIQYHDTNVLVNDKHYRYLKELWTLLNKEEFNNPEENKLKSDELVIKSVQNYGVSLINYAVRDKEYLGYNVDGLDKHWKAHRKNCPDMSLSVDKFGVIKVNVGTEELRFIMICSLPHMPKNQMLRKNTYILAYDNNDNTEDDANSAVGFDNIIPVSLGDITCVERIAIILRKEIFKQYIVHTLFKTYEIPRILLPYYDMIESFIKCIQIDKKGSSYVFTKYPIVEFDKGKWRNAVLNNDEYKDKGRMDQKKITDALDAFIDDYERNAFSLLDKLRCFDPDCALQINSRQCDSLSYIACSCGYVLDSSNRNHIVFYKKDSHFSPKEMGMDYLEINLN